MTFTLGMLATDAALVLAASNSDDDGGGLGLVFLLSGFIFYGLIYFKYRNVNKRHMHESETEAELHNMRGDDRFNRSLKGLSNRSMRAANNDEVRGKRNKFF